jgi:hypothetical protein
MKRGQFLQQANLGVLAGVPTEVKDLFRIYRSWPTNDPNTDERYGAHALQQTAQGGGFRFEWSTSPTRASSVPIRARTSGSCGTSIDFELSHRKHNLWSWTMKLMTQEPPRLPVDDYSTALRNAVL